MCNDQREHVYVREDLFITKNYEIFLKKNRKRLKHNSSGFFAFWEMMVEYQSSSRHHPIFFLILAAPAQQGEPSPPWNFLWPSTQRPLRKQKFCKNNESLLRMLYKLIFKKKLTCPAVTFVQVTRWAGTCLRRGGLCIFEASAASVQAL